VLLHRAALSSPAQQSSLPQNWRFAAIPDRQRDPGAGTQFTKCRRLDRLCPSDTPDSRIVLAAEKWLVVRNDRTAAAMLRPLPSSRITSTSSPRTAEARRDRP